MKNSDSISWVESKLIETRIDSQFYKKEFIENDSNLKRLNYSYLKDIYEKGEYGTLPDSTDYTDKGISLIRGTDLSGLFVEEDNLILVPETYFSVRSEIRPQDILILAKGATIDSEWSVSIMQNFNGKAICNGSIFRIRLKNEYNPYYFVAFMATSYFLMQKKRAISNVGIFYNDKTSIGSFVIPIPSPKIQKYIGDKVRKAEKLREEAGKLKKEAEELFAEIYEQPVPSDIKYEWVNRELLAVGNCFPNYYRQFELLKKSNIEFIEFKSIVLEIKCGIPMKSDMREGHKYPFYGASGIADSIGNYNFDGEYLIIAQDGSVGAVNIARGKFWANNHVWIVKVKESFDLEFLEMYLRKFPYWASLTTGSVVPKVTSENLKKLLIPIVKIEIQRKIGEKKREAGVLDCLSKHLINEARQDVEDLIEGNFNMEKLTETTIESRC